MEPDHADLLAAPVPDLTAAEAEAIARGVYGLPVHAEPLAGERDRNFALRDPGGERYVLKLGNPTESEAVIAFQSEALMHLERVAPDLPVPRLLRTRDGAALYRPDGAAGGRIIRVLTFVPGKSLHEVPSTPRLRRGIADLLGKLDLALGDFSHPASRHDLMWNLSRAGMVRGLLHHLPSDSLPLVARRLDRFEAEVAPHMAALRAQVIHNDMNPQNIVVHPDRPEEVAGIFDFGDMLHAPLVNDLATATAYQLMRGPDPLEVMAEMAASYCARLPLRRSELGLLPDLVATRLMLSYCISAWRATLHPDNRTYILRASAAALSGLTWLDRLDPARARDRLTLACKDTLQDDT